MTFPLKAEGWISLVVEDFTKVASQQSAGFTKLGENNTKKHGNISSISPFLNEFLNKQQWKRRALGPRSNLGS
jgi:hypothetical protein